MPGDIQQRLTSIESKARLLTERYNIVASQRDEAIARISELEGEVGALKAQIQQLAQQLEYMQVAASVEQSQADLEASRKFLSELVWEIDKCITQLSE